MWKSRMEVQGPSYNKFIYCRSVRSFKYLCEAFICLKEIDFGDGTWCNVLDN